MSGGRSVSLLWLWLWLVGVVGVEGSTDMVLLRSTHVGKPNFGGLLGRLDYDGLLTYQRRTAE